MKMEMFVQGKRIQAGDTLMGLKNSLFNLMWHPNDIEKVMSNVSKKQIASIKTRTRKGIGSDGQAFQGLASSTLQAMYPRPAPGEPLSGKTRGSRSNKNPLAGFRRVLEHLSYKIKRSPDRHRATLEIFIKNATLELDYGRTMTTLEMARIHQYGSSTPARYRMHPPYRIPIKSKKVGRGKDNYGIITRKVGPSHTPARPFMGWTSDELDKAKEIVLKAYKNRKPLTKHPSLR